MKIKLKKKSEGDSVLAVVRSDGSFTGDRLRSDGFSAIHDLTHHVVEQTLELDCGFFGLLERGWDIQDFENKENTAAIPDEAIVVECIVGQLTNLMLRGPQVEIREFNWLIGEAVSSVRPKSVAPQFSEETFSLLQERLANLLSKWRALRPGESLELDFPAVSQKSAGSRLVSEQRTAVDNRA